MEGFKFNFGGSGAAPLPGPAPPSVLASPPPSLCLVPLPSFSGAVPLQPLAGHQPPLLHYLVPDADAVSGAGQLDVVPHIYEGGAKIWECTRDLLQYLGQPEAAAGAALQGARVLDLGCGAGLLGVHALQRGAASVTFQDLNAPVLAEVCARNIAGNSSSIGQPQAAAAATAATLLAGDWGALLAALAVPAASADAAQLHLHPGFDVILSAETLYRPEAYATLCPLIKGLLVRSGKGSALALIATKRFYFGAGLGGGTQLFMEACKAHGLAAATVASHQDGMSNVRDIVQVSCAP